MPFGSLDLRLVIFHEVMRTAPGAVGREYESVAGISVFFGKLGSAVVSSDLGALSESESVTAFLRGFFEGVGVAASVASASGTTSAAEFEVASFEAVAEVVSTAFRFDFVGVRDGDAAVLVVIGAAALAVRLEERRAVVVGVAGAIVRSKEVDQDERGDAVVGRRAEIDCSAATHRCMPSE